MVERDLLFDHVRAASWSTGYSGVQQIPILQLTGATGDPVVIRFGAGSHRATADFVAATKTALARWLPSQTLSDSLSDPVRATRLARAGPKVAVTLLVLSIAGGYVGGEANHCQGQLGTIRQPLDSSRPGDRGDRLLHLRRPARRAHPVRRPLGATLQTHSRARRQDGWLRARWTTKTLAGTPCWPPTAVTST